MFERYVFFFKTKSFQKFLNSKNTQKKNFKTFSKNTFKKYLIIVQKFFFEKINVQKIPKKLSTNFLFKIFSHPPPNLKVQATDFGDAIFEEIP